MGRSTISKTSCVSNLLPIIGLIILNFCPIMVVKRALSVSVRVNSLVCPFLTPYSVSTIFLLLIPLILYLLLTIISFFLQNKWLNCLGLVFSICVFIVSICLMFVFKFTLLGVIFGVFLTVLMVAISAFKIYINKYGRNNKIQ